MVTPLQIDSYTRDLWGEFDPLAIAELSPVAYDSCYRPKIIVGLDSEAQSVPANGYAAGVRSLEKILELDHEFFSEPVSQSFLANQQGMATLGVDNVNYPNLLSSPYPVTGKGRFLFQIWNQTDSVLSVIPLVLTLEPK